ncbi:hypothetical protein SAMN05660472_02614 [Natronincola ferrireducens]|uniref:Signal transducing protein n=2 Tax=Natronincola ferrireducens TaxID=393762 RepID=A0A1G9HBI1_9FIRM|nr:hypothetical protein SAMN05660472_02614 [Natronincola ferrireducens]
MIKEALNKMWTVVYMTNTKEDAEYIEKILVKEGFLVKIKPISKNNENGTCEVLVPRSEVEEAHTILLHQAL